LEFLYDSNLWVALSFDRHPHFKAACGDFGMRDSVNPAAFCRMTQHAFFRLVTAPSLQKSYNSRPISNAEAVATYEKLQSLPQVIWLDEPDGLEALWFQLAGLRSTSPKVWMDAYLAAFAIRHEVGFVTADTDFKNFENQGLKLRLVSA
jgi:toxin-antitoxin system PIN domain toxin